MQRPSAAMKTLSVLALVALIAGCHFDKLFSGGGDTPLSHDPPAGLAFTSGPGNARAGQPLSPVRVAVVDSGGTPVAGADSLVTIALGANPSGDATLTGTDTAHAVNGVAMFSDLSIDKPGSGYTLTATVATYKERVGSDYGASEPASVSIQVLMTPAGQKQAAWTLTAMLATQLTEGPTPAPLCGMMGPNVRFSAPKIPRNSKRMTVARRSVTRSKTSS